MYLLLSSHTHLHAHTHILQTKHCIFVTFWNKTFLLPNFAILINFDRANWQNFTGSCICCSCNLEATTKKEDLLHQDYKNDILGSVHVIKYPFPVSPTKFNMHTVGEHSTRNKSESTQIVSRIAVNRWTQF